MLSTMFVAESLGHKVNQAEDTIGGCTLHMHRPSTNPDGCTDAAQCQTVDLPRVPASEACTIAAGIPNATLRPQYAPCPQLLARQPYGAWDVLVVQDQSMLPAVEAARKRLFLPAVREFSDVVKRQGPGRAEVRRREDVSLPTTAPTGRLRHPRPLSLSCRRGGARGRRWSRRT